MHKEEHHTNIYFLIIGIIGYIASYFIGFELIKNIILLFSMLIAGYHVIWEGIEDTITQTKDNKKFHPNIHLLMSLAAIGAVLIGNYNEATLLILIFATAHFLEEYAEDKSHKEITRLLEMNPTKARKIVNGKVKLVDVSSLKIGDQLQVLNGDQIPTDGLIIEGISSIDESAITGESIPKEKTIGDEVFGSTINGNGTFIMEVTKNSDETVFAKILKLVSETQSNISKTAAFIKRLEPRYVTIVLLISPMFYFGSLFFGLSNYEAFYRTMVFLTVASPCALAATDIPATLSALSRLAKRGVLFKGGSYLSNLNDIRAVAFDKTGTLTTGNPVVTDFYFEKGITKKEQNKCLDIIVSMESKSNHPLAKAIINHFEDRKIINLEVENIPGVGLVSKYEKNEYKIAKPSSFEEVGEDLKKKTHTLEKAGKTVIYFSVNNKVVLIVSIMDVESESSRRVIEYLKRENIRTVMITGDSIKTARAIGKRLKIDEVKGNVLPEEKSNIIKELKEKYKTVAMIGDGINDAPALALSDIGFAMGNGTDIAIDVADAVIMKNDLTRFELAHQTSKKLRKVVIQNMVFSISIIVGLVILNIFGMMNLPIAVVFHEGSTILVILNGLRLLKNDDIKFYKHNKK